MLDAGCCPPDTPWGDREDGRTLMVGRCSVLWQQLPKWAKDAMLRNLPSLVQGGIENNRNHGLSCAWYVLGCQKWPLAKACISNRKVSQRPTARCPHAHGSTHAHARTPWNAAETMSPYALEATGGVRKMLCSTISDTSASRNRCACIQLCFEMGPPPETVRIASPKYPPFWIPWCTSRAV